MNILHIDGKPGLIAADLFSESEEGHLTFGMTARSLESATLSQLETDGITFRDYLMEGFVKFGIQLTYLDSRLQMQIKSFGSNRDEFIVSHIKFYISQAGYVATEASNA
ncbi:MAG: hypothetical protein AB2777_20435 [Candidatus Thiodiazotropha endolucinida]